MLKKKLDIIQQPEKNPNEATKIDKSQEKERMKIKQKIPKKQGKKQTNKHKKKQKKKKRKNQKNQKTTQRKKQGQQQKKRGHPRKKLTIDSSCQCGETKVKGRRELGKLWVSTLLEQAPNIHPRFYFE